MIKKKQTKQKTVNTGMKWNKLWLVMGGNWFLPSGIDWIIGWLWFAKLLWCHASDRLSNHRTRKRFIREEIHLKILIMMSMD